jgi:hypothetical protein
MMKGECFMWELQEQKNLCILYHQNQTENLKSCK